MKSQYKWAIAAASALVIGVVSVQQTGALWRDSAQSDGGTITAGVLDITAGDGVKQFDLSGLALDNQTPGSSVQKALPVINSGNVEMAYGLSDVVFDSQNAPPMTLRIVRVADEQSCPETGDPSGDVLYPEADIDGAGFNARTVAAGQSEVLCLKATLGQDAAAGQSGQATFTFEATSVSRS